jgi:hypothetical protein
MTKISHYIFYLLLSVCLTACPDSEKPATPTATCNPPEGLHSRYWKLVNVTADYTIPADKKQALMNAARRTMWFPDCKVVVVDKDNQATWGTYTVSGTTLEYIPNNKGVTFGNIQMIGMIVVIDHSKCTFHVSALDFSRQIGNAQFQSMFGFAPFNGIITFEYNNI